MSRGQRERERGLWGPTFSADLAGLCREAGKGVAGAAVQDFRGLPVPERAGGLHVGLILTSTSLERAAGAFMVVTHPLGLPIFHAHSLTALT